MGRLRCKEMVRGKINLKLDIDWLFRRCGPFSPHVESPAWCLTSLFNELLEAELLGLCVQRVEICEPRDT